MATEGPDWMDDLKKRMAMSDKELGEKLEGRPRTQAEIQGATSESVETSAKRPLSWAERGSFSADLNADYD